MPHSKSLHNLLILTTYQVFQLRSTPMFHMLYCCFRRLKDGRLNTMVTSLRTLLRRMSSKHSSSQWPSTTQRKLTLLKLPVMPTKCSNHQTYHTTFKISLMLLKLTMYRRKVNSGYAVLLLRNSKQSIRDCLYRAQFQIWLLTLTITCSSRTAILTSPRVISKQCKDFLRKCVKRGNWMQPSIKNNS